MAMQTQIGTSNESFKNIMSEHSTDMQECIQDCIQCAQVCEQVIQHCLDMGGKHAESSHIKFLQDCAEVCLTSAHFMIRESDLHPEICGVCADACEACADDCESFSDDETMMNCAVVCRQCATSCQKMASQH